MANKLSTIFIGGALLISACEAPEPTVAKKVAPKDGFNAFFREASADVAQTCEGGGIVTNDEVAVSKSIDLRSGPTSSADRIINEKATAIIGETHYQAVDETERLRETCRQKDFAKVQVLEPSWLTHVTGWVPVRDLRAIERDASGTRTYVEADFPWDADTGKYKPQLVAAVNRIVRENNRCATVDPGTLTKSPSRGTAAKPVFFITCQGSQPFNVWFEPADAGNTSRSFAAIQNVSRPAAVEICEQAAKEAATNPQTVNFSTFLDLAFVPYANGNSRVISSFKAKNAFGQEAKFRIECFFEGQTMTERNIQLEA